MYYLRWWAKLLSKLQTPQGLVTVMVIHPLVSVLNLAHGKQMFMPALRQDPLCLSKAMSLPNLSFLTSHWILYFIPSLATHTFSVKILAVGSGKRQKSVAVPLCMNFSVLPPLGTNPEFPNLPAWFPMHNDLSLSPLSYPLLTSSYIFWERRFTFWVMWKHLLDMIEIYELWLPAPPPGPRKATPGRGWGGESRICRQNQMDTASCWQQIFMDLPTF